MGGQSRKLYGIERQAETAQQELALKRTGNAALALQVTTIQ